jgi:peptidoglycan-N-acetylglucosamine deacetylase
MRTKYLKCKRCDYLLSNKLRLKSYILKIVRHISGPITCVETDRSLLALTFDDGPDPEVTPRVVEVLRKYDAKATFFMLGECATKHPDIVKLVAESGHAIGNHSWSHHAFPLISRKEIKNQINACQKAISPYGMRIVRPPYGSSNNIGDLVLLSKGYTTIGWNLDSFDWCESNPASIVNDLVSIMKPGSIILFHDRIYDGGKPQKGPSICKEVIVERTHMLSALDELLERCMNKYQFVTIPVLLKSGKPSRELD